MKILLTAFTCIILLACGKNKQSLNNGVYTGTFTVKYDDGTTRTGETTLTLEGSTYQCTGGPNYTPAGGSGSFEEKAGMITFNDVNIWTANFDWNLILDGEYKYKFNGRKLIFEADKNNVGNYHYDLEKQ